jgi:ketosteroid isomerase-like protein
MHPQKALIISKDFSIFQNNLCSMKKVVFFAISWLSLLAASAQSKDEKTLSNTLQQLHQAMINADQALLNQLTSDSLSYGHSGGNIENKASFVDHLVSGQSDFVTIEVTDQTMSVVNNVGMIRFSLFANINDKGKPSTVKLKVLYIWVKDKKEWKLLARQAVKILP